MHNVKRPVKSDIDIVQIFFYRRTMTSREAYAVLAALVAEHGTTEGIQRAADLAGVGWHTAYGWWRRRSVPAWRANAFESKEAA